MANDLRLPVLAAPVDRTPGGAALSTGSGVDASGWWDDVRKVAGTIGDVAGVVGPPLISAL